MTVDKNKNTDSFIKRVARSIEEWSSSGFHIPTFVTGTGFSSELINHITSEPSSGDIYLSDRDSSCLPADLLIIGGIINIKNLHIIKAEYKKLSGKKYVVVIGTQDKDFLNHGYNIVKDLEEHLHVDLVIPGRPPRREDILNGLNLLKDIR